MEATLDQLSVNGFAPGPADPSAISAGGKATHILGPDGRPFRSGYDGYALPHVVTFQGVIGSIRTYLTSWDEALKHNRANAVAMRRDCYLMSLLRERQLPTARLNWHIEPDDPTDLFQRSVAERVGKIVRSIPHLQKLFMSLLEALWYGRYGSQFIWGQKDVDSVPATTVLAHEPVNGDKIQYQFDGTPCVLVHSRYAMDLEDAEIVRTDRGTALLLHNYYWRQRFAIHKHEITDADYLEPELAGGIHGTGIRSMVYWCWWLQKEFESWLTDFMERVGTGVQVFYYEAGNVESENQAYKAAEQQSRSSVIIWPRSPGNEKSGAGVEWIQPNLTGVETLRTMVQEYFDARIERFIVGQTLSGNAEGTGLGSGVADLHADTKYKVIAFDADNLAETLTTDLVQPIQRWNVPQARFGLRFVFSIEKTESEKKLEAAKTVYEMGVAIKEEEILEYAGLSKPSESDDVVQKQADASPFGTPGQEAPGGPGGGQPLAREPGGRPNRAVQPKPPAGGPPRPMSREGQPARYEGWITIGGHAEPDGKKMHVGGTPVFVDKTGKVTKGPGALVGRSPSHPGGSAGGRERRQGPGGGSERDDDDAPDTGGPLAIHPRRPGDETSGGGGPASGEPARPAATRRLSADQGKVTQRIGRMEAFFRSRGQDRVADWMGQLQRHVAEVGTDASLRSLGEEVVGVRGQHVQYEGSKSREILWDSMGEFAEAYLNRHGIIPVFEGAGVDSALPVASSQTVADAALNRQAPGDFTPADPTLANKLVEAQHLPGLESSEDLAKLAGVDGNVTHFAPDVVAKLDERYGKDGWIVKSYGPEGYSSFGVFFPQRVRQLQEDARNAIWAAGENLARYGFRLGREPDSGRVFGLVHESGDVYQFGTPEYANTVYGDAAHWAERARAAAGDEGGAELPLGGRQFMAQPAFPVVGVSEEERAAGKLIAPGEGRVHVVTRNGRAEAVPHSTWLKGQPMPVVFEDDGTRAMAQAAVDAINALPESERQGQIYGPDVVKTADGYRAVEANPAAEGGGSGYLTDNPLVIDAYTSHILGREPAHVRFVRNLLSQRARGDRDSGQSFSRRGDPCRYDYDPNEARDRAGKWTATGGGDAGEPHPGSTHGSSVKVKKTKRRAFDGATPVPLETQLTKQETGRVGEAVVLAYMRQVLGLKDARAMNSEQTNFPVDLIEDHAPTEVKAGLVSNTRGAQQWRLTFSKESAKEKALYETMTSQERAAWNEKKQQRIHQRKQAVLKAVERETGRKQRPRTITTVLNPDTRVADIYVFDGWHDRIDWQSDLARAAYQGSVQYG